MKKAFEIFWEIVYEELKDRMSLEFQVTEDTPRTFIWHTFEDQTVLLDNTLLFVQALYKKGIPVEYHVFPQGPMGSAWQMS